MQPQFITLPKQAKDRTDQRYGRLVALGPVSHPHSGNLAWLCQCDCGKQVQVAPGHLRSGHTRSCGCIKSEQTALLRKSHGMRNHPLYGAWKTMNTRCTNPNVIGYADYGGRGIKVCDKWRRSFKAYHDYVTRLPDYEKNGYSLDRIDNNGNYEPGNMRWASAKTQVRNSRRLRLVAHDGRTQCLRDWANELGISESMIDSRIRRGWSIERSLTTPSARSR